MRTCVGWFSSPACCLRTHLRGVQVRRTFKLEGPRAKVYTIGENFAQWLAHKSVLSLSLCLRCGDVAQALTPGLCCPFVPLLAAGERLDARHCDALQSCLWR